MRREQISQALDSLDERYITETAVYDPAGGQSRPERIKTMKTKRLFTLALAAALLLSLGAAAYALSGIHTARQEQIRAQLRAMENNVESLVSYELGQTPGDSPVLLAAINDGTWQKVYVDVSPVTEEELEGFPGSVSFVWELAGGVRGGMAFPKMPAEGSFSGYEEIHRAMMQEAYDPETQTLTLDCEIDTAFLEEVMGEEESVTVSLSLWRENERERDFGSFMFTPTEAQSRSFDFGGAVYRDENGREIQLLGLELTPMSAVWRVHYEGDAQWRAEQNHAALAPWSMLEDTVCMRTELVFSDGSRFSTGGALTCPYENGAVSLFCGWGRTIDIQDVQRIELNGIVLWETEQQGDN